MTAAKAVAAAIGVLITALTAALADEVLDLNEIGQLIAVAVAAVGTVYGVWKTRNTPVGDDDQAEPEINVGRDYGQVGHVEVASVLVMTAVAFLVSLFVFYVLPGGN
jgi:hypothetical protein